MPAGVIWRDVFTSQADARSVAWVRILIGADCIVRAFEGWRIMDRVLSSGNLRLPYVWWAIPPSPQALPLYVGVWAAAAAAFCLGWHTRVAGILLWALMTYVLLIDQQTYSNHLYLLSLIVLLLTVADSGRALSLDSRHRSADTVPAWPITLLKLQLSIVYAFSALAKINPFYLSGAVIYLNLRPELKAVFTGHAGTPMLMMMAAVLSIIIELWLAGALWSRRWRGLAASVGIAFHLGLVLSLTADLAVQLGVFALATVALYLVFFEHAPHPMTVYYDDGCGVCTRVVEWLQSRDKSKFITAIGSGEPAAWRHDTSAFDLTKSVLVVDDQTGERLTETAAFAAMLKALPTSYQPLRIAALPGFVLLSNRLYRLIARHRHRISDTLGLTVCRSPQPSKGVRRL
jgi:predicted DCC family thiol-disulfide oxidoreductase YuxK